MYFSSPFSFSFPPVVQFHVCCSASNFLIGLWSYVPFYLIFFLFVLRLDNSFFYILKFMDSLFSPSNFLLNSSRKFILTSVLFNPRISNWFKKNNFYAFWDSLFVELLLFYFNSLDIISYSSLNIFIKAALIFFAESHIWTVRRNICRCLFFFSSKYWYTFLFF